MELVQLSSYGTFLFLAFFACFSARFVMKKCLDLIFCVCRRSILERCTHVLVRRLRTATHIPKLLKQNQEQEQLPKLWIAIAAVANRV